MRKMLLLGSLLAIATAALPARAEAPWRPHVPVPHRCRAWARHVDDAPTHRQRWAAELSLASCEASARLDAAELPGGDATIASLGAAIEPSLAILDEVALSRDPAYQILAADTRGSLYVAAMTRARIAEHGLEDDVAPWNAAADAAYRSALPLAAQHPGLVISNPVVATAIEHSRAELTRPSVATR